MPHETDLPYTEYGSALEDRREQPGEKPTTGGSDRLTLAVCSRRGVGHYSEDTLSELGRSNARRRGGS